METFEAKRIWTKKGIDCSVEVSCHEGKEDGDVGKYRWAVYAYVYRPHRLYERLLADQSDHDLTCHSYQSYSHVHYNSIRVESSTPVLMVVPTCVQIGWDYNHLHDEWFTRQEMCQSVFKDAKRLMEQLT